MCVLAHLGCRLVAQALTRWISGIPPPQQSLFFNVELQKTEEEKKTPRFHPVVTRYSTDETQLQRW